MTSLPPTPGQLDLLDLLQIPTQRDGVETAQQFERFHSSHPAVYDLLVRLARDWARTNGQRIGIAALFERARWEIASEIDAPLNNTYRAFYARLIMRQEADLRGIFEVRQSTADRWVGR